MTAHSDQGVVRGALARFAYRLSEEGRAEQAGHVVDERVLWFDMSDSSGYCRCSCGWRTREVKVCWLSEMASDHRRGEVAANRTGAP